MNLSQQSSHLVLGTSTTLPVPAGIPAAAAAAAAAAEATEVGSSQTPLLSEKEVQVGHRGWVRYKDIVSWWLAQIEMDILLETME